MTRHPQPLRLIRTSEGTHSAVRIQRMHGREPVREWAEGVPFRTLAELRSASKQKLTNVTVPTVPAKVAPAKARQPECGGAYGCQANPQCPKQGCEGHPLNQPSFFDLRGKDYSDHHGPRSMAEYHRGRALFWRSYLGGLTVAASLLAWWLMR